MSLRLVYDADGEDEQNAARYRHVEAMCRIEKFITMAIAEVRIAEADQGFGPLSIKERTAAIAGAAALYLSGHGVTCDEFLDVFDTDKVQWPENLREDLVEA